MPKSTATTTTRTPARCQLCGRGIVRTRNNAPGFCSDAHKQEAYRLRRVLPSADDILRALYTGENTPEAQLRDRSRYLFRELRGRMTYAINQFLATLGEPYEASWPGSGHAMRPVIRKKHPRVKAAPATSTE